MRAGWMMKPEATRQHAVRSGGGQLQAAISFWAETLSLNAAAIELQCTAHPCEGIELLAAVNCHRV